MSLQALPDDILLGILQIFCWKYNDPDDIAQRFYLLSIFKRLRAIALPKVHNHVYISAGGNIIRKRHSYVNKYNKTFANNIDTNADIIALANCAHMVKSARIEVDGLTRLYAELCTSIKALQTCANVWPNITRLEIAMELCKGPNGLSESQQMQRCHIDKKYCHELANNMPGVTELLPFNKVYSSEIGEFYGHIADTYANQLVYLNTDYSFDHTGRDKLKVMQYLYISMHHNPQVLPRVNSHTLVDLHIDNVPYNVLWAPFLDSNDGDVIEFPCLKKLWLEFIYFEATENTNVDIPELQLNFPELSSLSITCFSSICPFFKMAKFPDVMDKIYICAPPALLAQINDMDMPTAKNIRMSS